MPGLVIGSPLSYIGEAEIGASDVNAYVLQAESGSFALTGNAAGLTAQRRLAADVGAYTLTGNAAILAKGFALAAATGVYTLTGSAASLIAARRLAAGVGAHVLTGNGATLLAGRLLSAAQGSYALVGPAASLRVGGLLSASVGSYALTGNTAGLLAARMLTASPGSYVLTGQTAQLLGGRRIAAIAGSYVLSGVPASLRAARILVAGPGTYTLSGVSAALSAVHTISAGVGAYVLTGNAAGLVYLSGGTLQAATGVYALTGIAADLRWSGRRGLKGRAVWTTSDGSRRTSSFFGGDHVASQLDATRNAGSFNGTSATLVYRKSHRWWPSAVLPTGWAYEYVSPVRTLFVIGRPMQSNGEGRGLGVEAAALENPTLVLRNTYSYDENLSGPGGDQKVGPLMAFADRLMTRIGPPGLGLYDRACIISLGLGGQTLAELWGTTYQNGTEQPQIDDPDVLGGLEGDVLCNGQPLVGPPTLLRPGDHWVAHVNQGESDASAGNITTWADEVLAGINWFRTVAYPSSVCKGISIAQLAPTEESTVGGPDDQARWDAMRALQMSLHAPTASPPRIVRSYLDADKKPGDTQHYKTSAQERMGHECADALVDDTLAFA